jgi:hypothetical protein
MKKLKKQQKIDYFNRSYKAVDGLWFMKVEKKFDFNTALELDTEVWKIMGKIQARMMKVFLGIENDPNVLFNSLIAKFEIEGFKFTTEKIENGFRIIIDDCPWHNLMVKSGREHLSTIIGKTICNTEYQVWASELANSIMFELKSQKCYDSKHCIMDFIKEKI